MATARRGGLGKGLGALITPRTPDLEQPAAAIGAPPLVDGSRLVMIDPRTVRPNPKQPRQHFDEEGLRQLAESMRNDGLQEPVIVRENNGTFELVSGERRVRAGVLADLDAIPAICREVSDDDMLKLGLIENIQREDLNPIELAMAYKALIDQFGWTQDELAHQVGKKRATVTNTLRLLNLPEDVQQHVVSGAISMGHARTLLAVSDPVRLSAMCRHVMREGLSVREVERLTTPPKPKAKGAAKPKARDPHVVTIEDELRRRLGTQVRLSADDDWKGKLEIEFYGLEDLERLLDILRS